MIIYRKKWSYKEQISPFYPRLSVLHASQHKERQTVFDWQVTETSGATTSTAPSNHHQWGFSVGDVCGIDGWSKVQNSTPRLLFLSFCVVSELWTCSFDWLWMRRKREEGGRWWHMQITLPLQATRCVQGRIDYHLLVFAWFGLSCGATEAQVTREDRRL